MPAISMKKFTSIYAVLFLTVIANGSIAANELETRFIAAGLVNISDIAPTVTVELVNSDPKKNIFRKDFYFGLKKAYLRKEVAAKLAKAQSILQSLHPTYSLHVYDAARPRSVSQKMYDSMKGTKFEKYVANPKKGSMHNYGVAVDITIVDAKGKELDMGPTPFKKSTSKLYWNFITMKMGKKVTLKQKQNRKLLTTVMTQAGFYPLSFEWWHFNGVSKDFARKHCPIIE